MERSGGRWRTSMVAPAIATGSGRRVSRSIGDEVKAPRAGEITTEIHEARPAFAPGCQCEPCGPGDAECGCHLLRRSLGRELSHRRIDHRRRSTDNLRFATNQSSSRHPLAFSFSDKEKRPGGSRFSAGDMERSGGRWRTSMVAPAIATGSCRRMSRSIGDEVKAPRAGEITTEIHEVRPAFARASKPSATRHEAGSPRLARWLASEAWSDPPRPCGATPPRGPADSASAPCPVAPRSRRAADRA
jgi:hypothetical protein